MRYSLVILALLSVHLASAVDCPNRQFPVPVDCQSAADCDTPCQGNCKIGTPLASPATPRTICGVNFINQSLFQCGKYNGSPAICPAPLACSSTDQIVISKYTFLVDYCDVAPPTPAPPAPTAAPTYNPCPDAPGFSCVNSLDCVQRLCGGLCKYDAPVFGPSTVCGIPPGSGTGILSTCGKQVADGTQGVCPTGSTCSGSSSIKSIGLQQNVIFCNDANPGNVIAGLTSALKTLIYVGIAVVVGLIVLCIFAHFCLARGIAALCCCCGDSMCGRKSNEPRLLVNDSLHAQGNYMPPPMQHIQQQQQQQQYMPQQMQPFGQHQQQQGPQYR